MKTVVAAAALIVTGALAVVRADQIVPVPIHYAPSADAPRASASARQPVYVYNQNLWLQQHELISGSQAQEIVDEFRTNYPKLGSPRILIYVNRKLADETAATKISYLAEPTLADRQTVRDVERLMGRPLRSAGATLVDEGAASYSTAGLSAGNTIGDTTNLPPRSRDADAQVADVAIEVLISSHPVSVAEIDGAKMYSVPDIQMTATRLKDAKIIGQATAADVINKAGGPVVAAKNFSVQDITEVTTLALMDDMSQALK